MKKYIAEALGTGTLALVVGLSLAGTFPVPTPVLAALVLGLFVYSIGHVSGTHINPAVTVGLWSIGKISSSEAGKYVVAQFLGAGVAMMLLQNLMTAVEPLTISAELSVGLAEALGTFFFTFGIASVVYGRAANVMSGMVVGGSLLLGITVAALLGSNGVLNPAVALGIGSLGTMYILGPVVGAVLGMQAYKYLQG
jgi:glycerol uptake facilitator-like aquaporin